MADVNFSQPHGFYETPLALELNSETQGATIRYTLDYTAPTETSTEYTSPINISTTTCVRATSFKAEWLPSNSVTQTYVFLDDVLTQTMPSGYPWGSASDYEMDPEVVYDPCYYDTIKDDLKAIPSMFVVINIDDMFGDVNGIYSNPQSRGVEWERPASLELFYPDG